MNTNQTPRLPRESFGIVDPPPPQAPERPTNGIETRLGKFGKISLVVLAGLLVTCAVSIGVVMSKDHNQGGNPENVALPQKIDDSAPLQRIHLKVNKIENENKEYFDKIPDPIEVEVQYTPEHDSKPKEIPEYEPRLKEILHHKLEEYKNHNKQTKDNKMSEETKTKEEMSEEKEIKMDICTTPECAEAAASLIESINLNVDPCENFYEFACGGWVDKHPLPDNGQISNFEGAANLIDKRLHLILNTNASASDPEPLHMIRRNYKGCIDQETMNSLGIKPLMNQLNEQGGYPIVDPMWDANKFSLEIALDNMLRMNIYPLIGVGIDADIYNTTRRIIYAGRGFVGPLGARVMANIDQYEELAEVYKKYIIDLSTEMKNELGSDVTDESIAADVEDMMTFETNVAKLMIDIGNDNEYHLTTIEGLQGYTDEETEGMFDWLQYFEMIFAGTGVDMSLSEPIYATELYYLKKLSTLLAMTEPRVLANFIGFFWVSSTAIETTYAMRNITYNFEKIFTGADYNEETWESYCIYETMIDLSMATSRAYVDKFFPPEAKTETEQLVIDMRASYEILMKENTWMKDVDREVALEKLRAIESFVAYPEWIINDNDLIHTYDGLVINDDEQYDNLVRIGEFMTYWTCATLRDKPESTFLMPPTIVNAFYNPLANSITILAGILQPPFYDHNRIAALNYGGIGLVIGHELTHGFDNTGRQFDKDGNMIEWWSEDTIDAFNDRAKCYVDQYNQFHPPELIETSYSNLTVNGYQTLGENIADNGGIREAFRAYQIYVERNGVEPSLPGLDEFDSNKLFYLGYAQSWCEHKNAQVILNQLASDPHSPGRFRVLGAVSNDKMFSEVWGCPVGSPMNRGDDSCLLW